MPETWREKHYKPSLELKWSYVCAKCHWIQECPSPDLLCCGLPMLSLSRLYQFAGKLAMEAMGLQDAYEKKTPARGDAGRGHKETDNLAYYLTARE